MSDTSVPTIGYYRIRGLAQPIRLLLTYKGVKFIDKFYGKSGAKTFDEFTGVWFAEKTILGLDFPGIPYYMKGTFKLTQSTAIMRYLGRKHGLIATDETGLVRQDLLEQQLTDIWMSFTYGLLFNKDYETLK
ncbi:unnamed protein product, partial [Medioppia subpectinata]